MEPPLSVEVFETEISTYWFDNYGILNAISKTPKRTIKNTSENFELVRRITINKKVPLIVYLTRSPLPDKKTRAFVAKELPTVYKAMAMVSNSSLRKIMMNALFKLKRPTIPMKTFSNDKEAKQWLKQFL